MTHIFDPKTPYAAITAFYALSLPEYRMDEHRHPRCEIMYTTKGKCCIYVKGQELSLEERQFIFLDANVPHRLFIPQNSPCSLINLEFSCQKDKTPLDLSELVRESPAFAKFCRFPEDFVTGNDSAGLGYALKDLITQLENPAGRTHTKDQDLLIRLLFFRMLLELVGCLGAQAKPAGGMHYLKKACAYISAHLTEEIRIPALAAYVGINKSYLQSLFSRYLDSTIIDYINRKRLELAVFLLTNSSLSITEVAFQSGYNSRQHFGNTFEKYYGMSPRSYRQLHGKAINPTTGGDFYYIGTDGNWTNMPLDPS